jgi:hypothetical protein
MQELLDLERRGWEALSTSGEAAAALYEEVLADEVLMLFPGGMVMDDRSQIVASMTGPPWQSFEISDERVLPPSGSAAVVAYRGTAVRGGADYTALFNSTYIRQEGAWRLALHQQTPV